MKLKLDENMPSDARAAAAALGHDVDTVVTEGLSGRSDADVLQAAVEDDRFIVTLDRGFGDVRRYPPGSHPGIAVLRLDVHSTSAVVDSLTSFLGAHDLDDFSGCIVVVRGHLVRVRRPG